MDTGSHELPILEGYTRTTGRLQDFHNESEILARSRSIASLTAIHEGRCVAKQDDRGGSRR
jgi:hypothetical protein